MVNIFSNIYGEGPLIVLVVGQKVVQLEASIHSLKSWVPSIQ